MKEDLIRAFGSDPIAYSTLQPGLSYFETSFGYLAYRPILGFDMTLGPPICADGDRQEIMERFFRRHRRPFFFYVHKDIADLAIRLGGRSFHKSGMGVDKIVLLNSTQHELHPRVRGALKKAKRGQLAVVEVRPSKLAAHERYRIEAITRNYLQKSKIKVEMSFINRPLSFIEDGLARMFVLQQGPERQIFGYVLLDPYFNHGRIQGYLLNLIRFESTRLWGVYYSAVAMLASLLRTEGIEQLSLGYCPLVDVGIEDHSPWLSSQMQWIKHKCANVEFLARLRELKDAFPGLSPQRYFVTPSPWAFTSVVAMIQASGIPIWECCVKPFVIDIADFFHMAHLIRPSSPNDSPSDKE